MNNFNTIKIKTQKYIEKKEDIDIIYDLLTLIGSLLILYAYIFNYNKKDFFTFTFNSVGSLIITFISYEREEYQIFTINFLWFLGSIKHFIIYLFGF